VASGCNPNIVLDSVDDAAIIDSILNDVRSVTNVNPSGASDRNLNFFANIQITKRWSPTLATALRYARQQDNASGLGGTVILDAVSLSNTWDFWDRWQLALRSDWTRRESAFNLEETYDAVTGQVYPGGTVVFAARDGTAFNSTQDAGIDTRRWGVAARITHQLFRSTSLSVQVRYDEQESASDTLGNSSDFKNILATFGVRYTFDPIKLW
jgi:hypothetical protein